MRRDLSLSLLSLFMLLISSLTILPARAPTGDVNSDGKVDIKDLCFIAIRYGCIRMIDPGYHPDADINQDDIIDICDISLCTFFYGTGVTTLSSQPNGPTRVRLSPTFQSVSVNNPVYINLEIRNVAGLSQYELVIDFDDSLMSFDSAIAGPVLSSVGYVGAVIKYCLIAPNKVLVGSTILGGIYSPGPVFNTGASVPASQWAVLATIKFWCTNVGIASIDFTANLYDFNINPINHLDQNLPYTVIQTP